MRPLEGRRALVTGAAGGLGRAITAALAAQGAQVMMSDLVVAEAFEADRRALEASTGGRIAYRHADLANAADITTLMQSAGAVDILVNNAVTRHFGLVETLHPSEWDADIAVNLTACFHTIRHALPGMKQRDWGRIINVSSIYGLIGGTERAGYVTTKHALIGLTKAVALECAQTPVTCNALCPGSTYTPAIADRIEAQVKRGPDAREVVLEKFWAERQPTRRFIEPEKVAALAAFLCGPAGDDITGAALPMDGAWSAM